MSVERREVRVKPHGYQPRNAELEEPVVILDSDGNLPTPEELARIALSPARIVEDPDA